MPSTVATPSFGKTCLTIPRLPFSLPRRRTTVSPLTIFGLLTGPGMLENLRSERGDLQEPAVAELAADGPEHARPARVEVVLLAFDDHARVLVELDDRAVGPAHRLRRAHDDRLDDLALLDRGARDRALHGADDDVADVRVGMTRSALHVDAQ